MKLSDYSVELTNKVKNQALNAGAALVGIGKLSDSNVVVMGVPLPVGLNEGGIADLPKMLKGYSHLVGISQHIVSQTAKELKERGNSAVKKTVFSLFGDFRPLARKAGLGQWGRNNLIVTPEYGPHLLFVGIFTDAQLIPDSPAPNPCIACNACREACPSRALSERGLNYIRCLPYSLRGCQDCVDACPVGRDKVL